MMIAKKTKQTGRSHKERKKTYVPPSSLDAPSPNSDDIKYRWIRVQAAGEDDPRNIAKRRREGYEFVRAEEHPDETYAVHESGKFAGVIGSGDVVLAKIPKDLVDSRNEWVNTRTRNQQRAVDESLLKEQHPSMPINQQRSSDVSHGRKTPQFDE